MSYNPIYSSDLFKDDGAIDALIKKILQLDDAMTILDKQRAHNIKRAKDYNKYVRKLNATQIEHQEVLEDTVVDVAELSKINVATEKAQKKLNATMTDAALKLAFYKEEQRKVNQVNKLTVKLNRSAEGSYDQLSARYSLLKIELNQMDKAQREAAGGGQLLEQEARDVYEQMKRLQEATGKYSLNVGNYGGAIVQAFQRQKMLATQLKKTREEFEALPVSVRQNIELSNQYKATIEGIEAELEALSIQTGQTAKDFEEASGDSESFVDQLENIPGAAGQAVGGLRGLGRQFRKLARNPVIAVIAALVGALTGLGAAFTQTEKGARILRGATAAMNAAFETVVDLSFKFFDGVRKFNENPGGYFKGWVTSLFNLNSETDKAINKTKGLGNAQRDSTEGSSLGFWEMLTKKYKENLEAIDNLQESQLSYADKNRELAVSVQEATNAEEKYNAIASDTTKSFKEQKEALEQARNAVEVRAKAELQIARNNLELINEEIAIRKRNNRDFEDLKDQQLQFQQDLIAAEGAYTLALQENTKSRSETNQDAIENDLDFIRDGFDKQKTVNERIVADQELTLQTRRRIYNETAKASEDAFKKQIDILRTYADEQINVSELLNATDITTLNEQIRALGLSGALEKQLFDAINDYKQASQEIGELQRDLLAEEAKLAQDSEKNTQTRVEALNAYLENVEVAYQEEIEAAQGKIDQDDRIIQADERKNKRLELGQKIREKIREDDINSKRRQTDEILKEIALQQQVQVSTIEASNNPEAQKAIQIARAELEAAQKVFDALRADGSQATAEQIKLAENEVKKAQNRLNGLLQGGTDRDIYDLLGFDFSEEQKAAADNAFNIVKNQLLQLVQLRQQVARENARIAADEVSQAQRALDTEISNRNAGFAHQVETRQKELAEAKKRQREAIEEQRKAQRQQVAINALQQTSNLITGTSEILKQYADKPFISIPLIALMWSTFIAAQTRAVSLTKRQFGQGGYEVVGGGTHASGNDTYAGFEVNGQPAYVERGEGVSIIRASKQRKYGKLMRKLTDASNKDRLNAAQIQTITDVVNGEQAGAMNAYVTNSVKEIQPLIYHQRTDIDTSRIEALLRRIEKQGSTIYDAKGRITKRDNVTYVYTS